SRRRWSAGEPCRERFRVARLRYTWMPLSQVYPIPPCNCTALPAISTAAAHAYDLAMDTEVAPLFPRATSRTAAETSLRATVTETSMSAHVCFTAWNDPILRPNCSRTEQ